MTGSSLRDRLRSPRVRAVLALGLLLAATCAHAQRAWLDRDQIHLGETVTLNIQSDDGSAPDYTALAREFDVSGHSSRTTMEISNGRTRTNRLYAVALRPRRAGEVIVPALSVGNGRTEPLSLMVQADAGATALADSNDNVFLRSEADDADPYVQQAVGWVVRLYAADRVQGQLVQPTPEGASIREIGDDTTYVRTINGRTWQVIERRYLLIPERSGEIIVPGARFEGRVTGRGLFDELFGGGTTEVQAPAVRLQVQAAPANAAQPWLPLHDLRIRYAGTPQDLRAGSAAALTVEVVADGAGAGQMPELQLPAIEGAQVFADPVQADESLRSGRPAVKLTRRFSIVPTRAGEITVPGMALSWWDVNAGTARQASLPAMKWKVAPANSADAAAVDATSATPATGRAARALQVLRNSDAIAGADRMWILATLAFAALWLVTLVWGLHRRAAAPAAPAKAQPDG